MRVLNLTQHVVTKDQIDAGVFEPDEETKNKLKKLLTFEDIPSYAEMKDRAAHIANIAKSFDVKYAMIGGAPYFMHDLEEALKTRFISPLHAFTKRESVDGPNGEKKSVFKHVGFVGKTN